MVDIKNKILESLKEYDPNLDTRDGSVINDILVGPLSLLLSVYEQEVFSILEKFSFNDIANVSIEEMDSMANFYLLERKTGTKAEGEIWFYLNYPSSISAQKGNLFKASSSGLYFEVTQDFYLPKLDTVEYYEGGYYVVGPIKVVASDYGEDYSLLAGTLFDIPNQNRELIAKISNKEDFSYAENLETNELLFERIKKTLYGSSLASVGNIKNTILNDNPYISAIEVIGAGSEYMWRDLILNSVDENAYNKETYYLGRSGLHDTYYDVPHSAWSLNYVHTGEDSEVLFPTPETWTQEISDAGYKGLYRKDDPNFLESKQEILAYDFYTTIGNNHESLVEYNYSIGKPWKFNDPSNLNYNLKNLEEISAENESLILGYQNMEEPPIPSSLPLEIRQALADGSMTAEEFSNWVIANSSLESLHNYYPLIHRQLDQNVNIGVEFSFYTGDSTEEGRVCYATTRRHNTQLYVHDGFGMALKKQPQYLIRLQNNNYGSDVNQRTADIQRLADENGLTVAQATNYLGAIKTNVQFLKYNVFLVDNNAITENLLVNYENLIETSTGINQFVQASKVWIEPNVEYFVKYFIYEGMGFKAWVSETPDNFDENNKVLYKGQSYPEYLQVTGSESYDLITGRFQEDTNRKSFGIGILNTRNYEWKFKDLKIYSLVETLPMHLFKIYIDPTKYNIAGALDIDYYGMAFDETLMTLENINVAKSKLKFAVYKKSTDSWEHEAYNYYDPFPQIISGTTLNIDNIKLSTTINDVASYLKGDNIKLSTTINDVASYLKGDYLYLAATAANFGTGYTSNLSHTLRSYYVEVRNGNPPEEHRGNCVDIYCFDPKNYKTKSVIATLNSSEVTITDIPNIDGFILDVLSVKEYYSGVEFTSEQYTLVNLNKGETFGNDAEFKLVFASNEFDGAVIEITYIYWTRGTYVNSLITSSENRFPSADYKVKVMPVSLVKINELKYSGGLSEEEMKDKIIEYVNSSLTEIDKSDFVDLLYDNGATFVDLTMDVEIIELDLFLNKTYKAFTNQTYTIPSTHMARLYTNSDNIIQLTQL